MDTLPDTFTDCLFCQPYAERLVYENATGYAILDGFPVTKYHALVIPKRHVETYFELSRNEVIDCHNLLNILKDYILNADKTVEGFNIGINSGKAAGQTIAHCHVHLIPRRHGDVANPRGGIRNVIPGKGEY